MPPPETINLTREQLARQGRVPPSLALFFSMAEGTVKKLAAGNDNGWYVVQLSNIESGQIAANDPQVYNTLQQLGRVAGDEYLQQFVKAAQREVGVERNEAAIKSVEAQLAGNRTE